MRESSVSQDQPGEAPSAGQGAATPGSPSRLGALRRGARGTVVGIAIGPSHARDAVDADELERRLLEMGFVEGARFELLHEGPVGGDPIVVKLDDTRVALRRRDALVLLVQSDNGAHVA